MTTPISTLGTAFLAVQSLDEITMPAVPNAASIFDASLKSAMDRPETTARPRRPDVPEARRESPRSRQTESNEPRSGGPASRRDASSRTNAEDGRPRDVERDALRNDALKRKEPMDKEPIAARAEPDEASVQTDPTPAKEPNEPMRPLPEADIAGILQSTPTELYAFDGVLERLARQGIDLDFGSDSLALEGGGADTAAAAAATLPSMPGKQEAGLTFADAAPVSMVDSFKKEMAGLDALAPGREDGAAAAEGKPRTDALADAMKKAAEIQKALSASKPTTAAPIAADGAGDVAPKEAQAPAPEAGIVPAKVDTPNAKADLELPRAQPRAEHVDESSTRASAAPARVAVVARAADKEGAGTQPDSSDAKGKGAEASAVGTSKSAERTTERAFETMATEGLKSAKDAAKVAAPLRANQAERAEHVAKVMKEVETVIERGKDRGEVTVNTHDGWVKVKVELSGTEVKLAFTAESTSMRDALQSGMSDLKQSLEQRGYSMSDQSSFRDANGQSTSDRRGQPDQGQPNPRHADFRAMVEDATLRGAFDFSVRAAVPSQAEPAPRHDGKLHVTG